MIDKIDQILFEKDALEKEDFIEFLNLLATDFDEYKEEWVNLSIPDYLERIAGWIEDFSQSPANHINWDKVDFKILAIIFYMGRIYE